MSENEPVTHTELKEVLELLTEEVDKKIEDMRNVVNENVGLAKALRIQAQGITEGFNNSVSAVLKKATEIESSHNELVGKIDALRKKQEKNAANIQKLAGIITSGESTLGDLKPQGGLIE